MSNKSLILTNVHLILTTLITSTHAFIDGPLDWADTFTCTTGFEKYGRDEQYGWRSGTKEKYFGIGKGALTLEEEQALGRSD
ncbi:hypothetical protein N0V87_009542 [Didymella glomerata]|uniref:Uncharacterized protein n=1 Tax=Didymella glomerata TaxID=749621 RepID=A0A9W9BVJ0_9PLEO|nr:hypothetical protein N0V87_009542 [Didymella glomerata]